MAKPPVYKDEYRMHPSDSEGVPSYLRPLLAKMHETRSEGRQWACDVIIQQDPHSYSVQISPLAIVVSNSMNGETDTARYDAENFDQVGGIVDLINTLVSSGALPESASQTEIEVTEL